MDQCVSLSVALMASRFQCNMLLFFNSTVSLEKHRHSTVHSSTAMLSPILGARNIVGSPWVTKHREIFPILGECPCKLFCGARTCGITVWTTLDGNLSMLRVGGGGPVFLRIAEWGSDASESLALAFRLGEWVQMRLVPTLCGNHSYS